MKRPFYIFFAIVLFTAALSFAQDPSATSQKELDPQMKPATEPPRSRPDPNVRRGEDSSSADRDVDISPPPGDNEHPGSLMVDPDDENDVVEMKPWNPHQADKELEVGMYYFKRQNYVAAESRFRSALLWQDNHAEATYRLATALEKLKHAAEARTYYQQYLKILPKGEFAADAKKALARLGPPTPASQAKATSQP